MEKAILKTLIYSDIFDYPLKAWEIHKWLIEKKGTLKQIDKILQKLVKKGKVDEDKQYFFLKKRKKIVRLRLQKEKISKKYLKKINLILYFLKLIPTLKLIGISGGLAIGNSGKKDDIDLFIITSSKSVWFSRLLLIFLLNLLGLRRKKGYTRKKAIGKICTNIILDEDNLVQLNKDIYVAHEVLQMRILYQKNNIYSRFLAENNWAFKYLPNWITSSGSKYQVLPILDLKKKSSQNRYIIENTLKALETMARWLQIRYMGKPQGLERISNGALYFLPKDYRSSILNAYVRKLKKLSLA
ncbi:hypothetical protein HYS91_01580 [Candidatus Daviesbacteria bacterium]|nr:hypothetical protein [Candidatus Daviesbacteria bacterium]